MGSRLAAYYSGMMTLNADRTPRTASLRFIDCTTDYIFDFVTTNCDFIPYTTLSSTYLNIRRCPRPVDRRTGITVDRDERNIITQHGSIKFIVFFF